MIVPIFHIISFRRRIGKTTLLEKVIRELRSQGFKVIAVKYTAHEQLDFKDKDTHRLKSAGAECVVGISRREVAVIFKELELMDILRRIGVDRGLVLVEGFKSGPGYKLLITDEEVDVSKVKNLIALLVKKHNFIKKKSINGIKVLDYYNINQVTDLIKKVALSHVISILPRLDCGMCGKNTCEEFALDFLKGIVSINDCRRLKTNEVKLVINGNEVPLSHYPASVFKRVILALVSTLKGIPKEPKHILLELEIEQSN